MLRTTIDFPVEVAFRRIGLDLLDDFFYQGFPLATLLLHHMGNLVEFDFVQITEG